MPTTQTGDLTPASAPAPPTRGGRYLPAFLDAIVPGLGHLVAGRVKLAILFLIPVVVLIAAAVYLLATSSMARIAATLLDPDVIILLLVVQGAFLLWRLLAVATSVTAPGLPRLRIADALPIALLALVVVIPQGIVGLGTELTRETADEIFVEPSPLAVSPSAVPEADPSFLTPASLVPGSSLLPSASPSAAPLDPRINAVIVGVDSASTRSTYLTDTMIIVSFDPTTKTVSMVSVPRDMVDVPLGDGRKFRGKINSLVAYARNHPKQFPGSDGTGFDVLRNALGKLVGLDIPYYATVNLLGFAKVVNALGGVDVNVARGFCDPTYHGDIYGYDRGFAITAGKHHLNGLQALAYARVRKAAGESDFTRAARQQEVLSGMRDAIEKGGFLNDPIGLFRGIKDTVQTNLPRKMLPDLAEAAAGVDRSSTYRAVITYPLIDSRVENVRGYVQIPQLDKIERLANRIFPTDGSVPDKKFLAPKAQSGKAKGSGVSSCAPAKPRATPKPKPTPKPTKKPPKTPKPTATPTPTPAEPEPTPSEESEPAP